LSGSVAVLHATLNLPREFFDPDFDEPLNKKCALCSIIRVQGAFNLGVNCGGNDGDNGVCDGNDEGDLVQLLLQPVLKPAMQKLQTIQRPQQVQISNSSALSFTTSGYPLSSDALAQCHVVMDGKIS
jgi:hypothetical protein